MESANLLFETFETVGRYQIIQLCWLFLFFFENTFHVMTTVYIGYRPSYHCNSINITTLLQQQQYSTDNLTNIAVNYGKCEININFNDSDTYLRLTESCINGFNYSIPGDHSTVTEWDLVCDGAERSEFAQTLLMIGMGAGAAIFSPLADRFGRKPSNVASRILYFITALVTVFSPDIAAFSIFRFLTGVFQGGSTMTCTILYLELLPKRLRHRGEGMALTAWTSGVVFVTLIGYLCRTMSWRYMQLILALVSCHTLFDWLFIDESFKWLLANAKTKEAQIILRKAAKTNNTNRKEVCADKPMLAKEMEVKVEPSYTVEDRKETNMEPKVERYTVFTMLKHRRLLVTSLIVWFVWITNTLTYYGLLLTTSTLSGDMYLNNILAAVAEYPAIIFQQLLVDRIGRKLYLIIFHGIAGLTLVLATVCTHFSELYSWLPILATVFSIIGRFAAIGTFSTIFLYTPELYPTNMRNVGIGTASVMSRAGSMMSPFAITLAGYVSWGPAAIFAIMNVFVTIFLLFLPETMGRELPTTVLELKSWYKEKPKKGTKLRMLS